MMNTTRPALIDRHRGAPPGRPGNLVVPLLFARPDDILTAVALSRAAILV